jgi:phospholipid transport system substrate-binding protein
MNAYRSRWAVALVAVGVLMAGAARAAAAKGPSDATLVTRSQAAYSDAQAVVDRLHDGLIGVMKGASSAGFEARARALDPLIRGAFNLPLMAKTAVGPYWERMTEAQRAQLVDAFSRLSVAHYADRFKGYSGERFELLGAQSGPRDSIVVETRLLTSDGDTVSLNYLARPAETGGWKLVDVFVDGSISELAVRRSEYTSVLRSQGVDGLLQTLERKIAQLAMT